MIKVIMCIISIKCFRFPYNSDRIDCRKHMLSFNQRKREVYFYNNGKNSNKKSLFQYMVFKLFETLI